MKIDNDKVILVLVPFSTRKDASRVEKIMQSKKKKKTFRYKKTSLRP